MRFVMTETEKAVASTFKWILVIIVAVIAYKNVAPNYYFMRQGP